MNINLETCKTNSNTENVVGYGIVICTYILYFYSIYVHIMYITYTYLVYQMYDIPMCTYFFLYGERN